MLKLRHSVVAAMVAAITSSALAGETIREPSVGILNYAGKAIEKIRFHDVRDPTMRARTSTPTQPIKSGEFLRIFPKLSGCLYRVEVVFDDGTMAPFAPVHDICKETRVLRIELPHPHVIT